MSKGILVLFLSALIVCSVLTQDVEATNISYGAIGHDQDPGCSPKNPTSCQLPKANPSPPNSGS
ncbi:hypothetical protein Lal_00017554 [Lupinus albus]|nr:hypothetical protein Lal_00017554 [Lupinus albus]